MHSHRRIPLSKRTQHPIRIMSDYTRITDRLIQLTDTDIEALLGTDEPTP
jgi:hypothetical protein